MIIVILEMLLRSLQNWFSFVDGGHCDYEIILRSERWFWY